MSIAQIFTLVSAVCCSPVDVRGYNDQLMQVERTFTVSEGLPERSHYKHLIYAPSAHDAYAGSTFPGLVDLMFQIESEDDPTERWQEVKRHFASLVFVIEAAASSLRSTDHLH